MFDFSYFRLRILCLTWAVISIGSLCGAPLSVVDQKGRAIEIELDSVAGESVTFRKAGDAMEFALPLANFAADSQDLIRKEASRMPVALPKIQAEVISASAATRATATTW